MTTMEQVQERVTKTQNDLFAASRRMAVDITHQVTKIVPPLSEPIVNVVSDVFDLAERILGSEQNLVTDVVHDIQEAPSTKKAPTAKTAQARRAGVTKTTARRTPATKASS